MPSTGTSPRPTPSRVRSTVKTMGPTTPSAASWAIAPATRRGDDRVDRRSRGADAAAGCVTVWEVMPPRYGRAFAAAPRAAGGLPSGYPETASRSTPSVCLLQPRESPDGTERRTGAEARRRAVSAVGPPADPAGGTGRLGQSHVPAGRGPS